MIFQSTPSARRATVAVPGLVHAVVISIHALREEGDDLSGLPPPDIQYFNPRPPRGGRQISFGKAAVADFISIHALREEGDAGWFR